MLSFFSKNKDNESNKYSLHIKTAALLIYAAKIDENYSDIEKKIIKTTLINLGVNEENLEKVFKEAEKIESNSNQILEFTKEIKNSDENFKIKIIETLWSIIYSDNNLFLQTEYRQVNKNSEHILDFSLNKKRNIFSLDSGSSTKTHFFSNSLYDLKMTRFEESNLEINLQHSSNDTYLKKYNIL